MGLFAKSKSKIPAGLEHPITSFALYAHTKLPSFNRIVETLGILLDSSELLKTRSKIEVVDDQDSWNDDADVIGIIVGDICPLHFQRRHVSFPLQNIESAKKHTDILQGSQASVAVVTQQAETPGETVLRAVCSTMAIQAIHLCVPMQGVVWGPSAGIYSPAQWTNSCNAFVNQGQIPINLWVQMLSRNHSRGIDIASVGMPEMFGLPDIELWDSPRDEQETMDLLESALLDTTHLGSIAQRGKSWSTKTGVQFRVSTKRSRLAHNQRVTRLTEVR